MAAAQVFDAAAQDAALAQFLSVTEDRVDLDVAQEILEAAGWNVDAAVEQLFWDPASCANARPTDGVLADDIPQECGRVGANDAFEQALRSAGASEEDGALGFHIGAKVRRTEPVVIVTKDADGMPHAWKLAVGEAAFVKELCDDGRIRLVNAQGIESGLLPQSMFTVVSGQDMCGVTFGAVMGQQALRAAQAEERLQRQALREQQEAELAESILMDQMREQAERERAEAKKAAEQARMQEEQHAERLKQQAEHEKALQLEAKKARLPEEPQDGEPERVSIMVRTPNGQRLKRAFRASEPVGAIYDFLDVQDIAELPSERYLLVSSMPRKAFQERQKRLKEAGIQNKFVLMIELLPEL